MDHRAVLASLPPETRAALTLRSDAAGLRHLAVHLGAIALCTGGILAQVPFWWALILPQGILLIFLFTLLHETSHRTAFATDWLNDVVAKACGVVLFLPPIWFRAFHFAHHRHTQQPGLDPELDRPKPQTRAAYAWHLTGLPVWRGHAAALWNTARGRLDSRYMPPGRHAAARAEARFMLAGYAVLGAALALGATGLLWAWLVPLLLGQPFLRALLLAEHGGCPPVTDMLANTRTTFTNRLIRWLAWNMPYHAEHHTLPTVPFHALPRLHDLIAEHLKTTAPGYAAFHRSYRTELQD